MRKTTPTRSPSAADFEPYVREHQASLRAFLRALGAEEAWVDDLAQEAFLVAYRRFTDFEVGTDFGKWLRAIARRVLANERRKETRRSRLLPAVLTDALSRHEPEPESPDFERLVPALRECVEGLPARSRELLWRRYAGDENATSLARVLQVKADTVRQQLLRIRLAVRECLDGKGAGGLL